MFSLITITLDEVKTKSKVFGLVISTYLTPFPFF